MPITPFHLGPGLAIKALIPRHFSFTIFCFTQVVTDCEVAYFLLRRGFPVHRWCHTYLGATVVGVVCAVVGRPICQLVIRWWLAKPDAPFKRYFTFGDRIPLFNAALGALLGTYSHVFLDSIMHADMEPLRPWSIENPTYQAVSLFTLHAGCFIAGVLGAWRLAASTSH
jgi:hypothetical protein